MSKQIKCRGSEATEIPYKIKDDLVIKTKVQPFNAENKKSATATSKEQRKI